VGIALRPAGPHGPPGHVDEKRGRALALQQSRSDRLQGPASRQVRCSGTSSCLGPRLLRALPGAKAQGHPEPSFALDPQAKRSLSVGQDQPLARQTEPKCGEENPAAAQALPEELGQLGPADSFSQKLFSVKIRCSLTQLSAGLGFFG